MTDQNEGLRPDPDLAPNGDVVAGVGRRRIAIYRHGLDAIGSRDADRAGAVPQPGLELIEHVADSLANRVSAAVGDVQEADGAEQRVQAGGDDEHREHDPTTHAGQRPAAATIGFGTLAPLEPIRYPRPRTFSTSTGTSLSLSLRR